MLDAANSTTRANPVPPSAQGAGRSAFFRGIAQIEMPDDVGVRLKMPVFYTDNTSMSAIFTASSARVRPLLPRREMHPIELRPGRCLVAFSAFEYRASDIGPYGEVSVAFLISFGRRTVPGLGVARCMIRRCWEAYIWQLPVTTEIARRGGVDLYGYPKFLADIHFDRPGDGLACRLSEGGRHILTLRGPALPTSAGRTLRFRTYSVREGHPLCANVYTNPVEFAQTPSPAGVRLDLGDHEIARRVRELDLGRRPVFYQYSPKNEVALFWPRNLMDD